MSKVIGIVGSRRRNSAVDYAALIDAFNSIYQAGDSLISGGCSRGGDRFAEKLAKAEGIPIAIHYPNWKEGRHAGFVRNTLIAEDCDVLIAVVAPDRRGGTEDTIKKAEKLGKQVILVE